MSSSATAASILSELDLCITANGGAAKLSSSSASSDLAVMTVRQNLKDHIEQHGDTILDSSFIAFIPVDLPMWVPKLLRKESAGKTQHYRVATASSTSSKRADILRMKAELARAREARLEAELMEAEHDEARSSTSRQIDRSDVDQ